MGRITHQKHSAYPAAFGQPGVHLVIRGPGHRMHGDVRALLALGDQCGQSFGREIHRRIRRNGRLNLEKIGSSQRTRGSSDTYLIRSQRCAGELQPTSRGDYRDARIVARLCRFLRHGNIRRKWTSRNFVALHRHETLMLRSIIRLVREIASDRREIKAERQRRGHRASHCGCWGLRRRRNRADNSPVRRAPRHLKLRLWRLGSDMGNAWWIGDARLHPTRRMRSNRPEIGE